MTAILGTIQDNAYGQLTSRTFGNSVVETRGFNNRGQLTSMGATRNSTPLLGFSYDYGTTNNVGRIRSRTDSIQADQSATYTYDGVYRLTDVANSNWNIHWGFDAFGNRTTQTPAGAAIGKVGSPTYGYVNNKHASSFTYDDQGNITNDGSHNYIFDAENRITQVDGGTVQFAYDSEGRRIRKTASGVTTYYFYGLTGLMSEFTTANTGATQAATTNVLQYRVGEQTGTAVLMTDASGATVSNNRVFPYGELWDPANPSPVDQKFTTYDRESISNLDYAMARFYANKSGRFTSPDPGHVGGNPANPQSWNAYTYGANDPINTVDPSGTDYQVCAEGGGCFTVGTWHEYWS